MPVLNVCAVCHTRITQIQPSGIWIHARAPRRWHEAVPSTAPAAALIDSTKEA